MARTTMKHYGFHTEGTQASGSRESGGSVTAGDVHSGTPPPCILSCSIGDGAAQLKRPGETHPDRQGRRKESWKI